ncbi:hypothetical protein ABG067_008166, partial [Albugo candida]
MVRWISLAVLSLALSWAQALSREQQTPIQVEKIHLGKDATDRAHKLLRHNPLIDTHNDLPMWLAFEFKGKFNDKNFNHFGNWSHTDIERLHEGHVSGQFWSIYFDCEFTDQNQVLKAMESIDATKRMIDLYPKTFKFVTNTKQFEKATRHGRIASMMGMEGGQMIDSNMAALRQFYALGVRYMT